jgi:hypothetical protein
MLKLADFLRFWTAITNPMRDFHALCVIFTHTSLLREGTIVASPLQNSGFNLDRFFLDSRASVLRDVRVLA